MTSPEPVQDPIIAVLHRHGDAWVAVAGVPLAEGRIQVVQITTIDDNAGLQPWLDSVGVSSVRVILPASEVICRSCSLPDDDDDSLDEALRLQAETQLLGTTPAHRLAVALLPASATDAMRTGLILAWPESSPFRAPPLQPTPLYVPDAAAVASLLSDARPAEPILWIDPHESSLVLALAYMNGIQLRALREDFSGTEASSIVSTIVTETALNADLPMDRASELAQQAAAKVCGDRPMLILPTSVQYSAAQRLEWAGGIDEATWNRAGIALGGLLATSDDLVPMTMFQQTLPQVKPTLVEAASQQLSTTRIAIWLVAASILVLLFAPLAISGVRLGLLQLAHPSLEHQFKDFEARKREYAMYRSLSQEAWPITKLLADIANSTPRGIELEGIKLGHGEPLRLTGMATPPSTDEEPARLLTLMKDQLESMGIFNDVVLRWDDPETFGPRTFSLDATVMRPLYRAPYQEERDFGAYTLADRIYGREAVGSTLAGGDTQTTRPGSASGTTLASPAGSGFPTTPPADSGSDATAGTASNGGNAVARTPDGSGRTTGRRPSGSGDSGTASRADGDNRAGNTGATKIGRMPELLTPGQIATMTEPEIRQQLVEVAQAKKRFRNNPEQHQLLLEQFDLLIEGLKDLKKP